MEPFKVHILGCGSALPTLKHFASSQVVEIRGKYFMIDCGEGTQIQLRRSHVAFTKISAVFISHLHGDHCFGLIGLISTFGMLGRTATLHVYAPGGLGPMLESQMEMFCNGLDYSGVSCCRHDTAASGLRRPVTHGRDYPLESPHSLLWLSFSGETVVAPYLSRYDRLLRNSHFTD